VSVDEGADIVAMQNRNLYSIQVKSKSRDRGRYAFAIPVSTFELQDPKNSFYVLVLRDAQNQTTYFLVIPYYTIQKAVEKRLISRVSKRGKAYYQFVIAQVNTSEFYLKSKRSGMHLSRFHDNWNQLK
jgi:hypothetical protein